MFRFTERTPMISWLEISEIAEIFEDEMVRAGGTAADSLISEGKLFSRGVLPKKIRVAARDFVKGGVALRATDTDLFIHPYVFRIVCSNGAIFAQATETRHISRENWFVNADADLEATVRSAIQTCLRPEAFQANAQRMSQTQNRMVDHLLSILGTMRQRIPTMLIAEILHRYDQENEQSLFSAMNAVTSVARDARDPEVKWRLENLGGTLALLGTPPKKPIPMRATVLA
jgi:hypothetical protein